MAAVPITIVGTFTSDSGQVSSGTLQGLAFLTGVGIGGGPIIPPVKPPDAPHPEHPIILPGDPGWGDDLHPEHPIVIPKPPVDPPTNPPEDDCWVKAPPPNGGWGYHKDLGWLYYPGSKGAGPK